MWDEMMKQKGRHPDRALTALKVKALKEPRRYADGNGLYLVVEPSGAKRWVLRIMVQGRRRDIGLGGAQLVSLADAREKAINLRRIARAGGDPIAEKKAKAGVPTFAEAARLVHAEHLPAWRNEKHAAQWIDTLERFVFPTFGDRLVNQIDTPDVLRALSPIWLTRPETARRVRQRIRTVLGSTVVPGYKIQVLYSIPDSIRLIHPSEALCWPILPSACNLCLVPRICKTSSYCNELQTDNSCWTMLRYFMQRLFHRFRKLC